ncbi:hypothetical protein JJB09_04960 [Rhizobium sp. KVB221]|uniref:Uncharacterized protein n=1 Tax=Rhizobium setariae TaxID=2801340 RepID=A0A936YS41_9HYPH|nr:hypothetical protein [Rhizobium setariae]
MSVATSVVATPRYSALQYSCGAIQSLIEQHGAAIFRYPSPRKPSLTLYDRYVSNKKYCAPHQITERVHIPSADTNRCLVRHCITADCDDIIGRCLYR